MLWPYLIFTLPGCDLTVLWSYRIMTLLCYDLIRLWPYQAVTLTGYSLTGLFAEIGVEALRFQHDEQRAPAQQHSGEQQVLHNRSHRHPPAAREGRGQCWSHGSKRARWRKRETDSELVGKPSGASVTGDEGVVTMEMLQGTLLRERVGHCSKIVIKNLSFKVTNN